MRNQKKSLFENNHDMTENTAAEEQDANRILEWMPALLKWFSRSARQMPWRDDPTDYHVWISEIMLQQTRVEAVREYYARFMEAMPDVESLAAMPEERLLKYWEGLGYYSRARNLKKAAEIICRDYEGHLPKDAALLRKLPGIGPYSAGAIASIAYGMNEPAVDGNVLRVLSRVLGSYDDIMAAETRKRFEKSLREVYPHFPGEAGNITQSLMELGALVCVPNGAPACVKDENAENTSRCHEDACPLASYCIAYRKGLTGELPVKAAKAEKKEVKMTVFVLTDESGETVILRRRPENGLLAGMYEYPHVEGVLKKQEAVAAAERFLLGSADTERTLPADKVTDEKTAKIIDLKAVGEATHIFSHIVWKMKVYRGAFVITGKAAEKKEEEFTEAGTLLTAKTASMKSEYPMPAAFSQLNKFL